mmetsp:Transcript_6259/g.11144  ORF Transcript_6259/g.11144 Transcript_6259/m.11144 type:complete len:219 (+) Transcript_6259:708-1364(+)
MESWRIVENSRLEIIRNLRSIVQAIHTLSSTQESTNSVGNIDQNPFQPILPQQISADVPNTNEDSRSSTSSNHRNEGTLEINREDKTQEGSLVQNQRKRSSQMVFNDDCVKPERGSKSNQSTHIEKKSRVSGSPRVQNTDLSKVHGMKPSRIPFGDLNTNRATTINHLQRMLHAASRSRSQSETDQELAIYEYTTRQLTRTKEELQNMIRDSAKQRKI